MAVQSLEYMQLEAGTSTSVLHPVVDEERMKWMQPTWLILIRQTLLDCEGKPHIKYAWIPPIQRVHDRYIMEEFANKYKKSKLLKKLKRFSMSLNLITLSNMTTSTGKQICPFALKG